MDYRRVRQCAQKQTETVGLVQSLDILIRHAVWLFGQDDPAPPPHLSGLSGLQSLSPIKTDSRCVVILSLIHI